MTLGLSSLPIEWSEAVELCRAEHTEGRFFLVHSRVKILLTFASILQALYTKKENIILIIYLGFYITFNTVQVIL